ncbi:unnamed protein product [Schistosoma turkestanicum]|nr:unnamed protein product [Schistosoma turkestanicum]
MSEVKVNSICDKNESCIFNSTYDIPLHETYGFVLIGIALFYALIIILIKSLHTTSTSNTIIIILTLIMMIIGVALLAFCRHWYEWVIAVIVSVATTIFAIVFGDKMEGSPGKWRIIIFSLCCALVAVAFVCSILGIICSYDEMCKIIFPTTSDNLWQEKMIIIVLAICSAMFWCEAMFIAIALTAYYLKKYIKVEDYSAVYMSFIFLFEYMILMIVSLLHVNYFFQCLPKIVHSR